MVVLSELSAVHRFVLCEHSAASGPNLRRFACGIARCTPEPPINRNAKLPT